MHENNATPLNYSHMHGRRGYIDEINVFSISHRGKADVDGLMLAKEREKQKRLREAEDLD